MADSRTVRGVLLALLIAIYLAVRLWGLTNACLWFDEIFSVHAAEHGWGEILNFVALDLIHPPLSYVLLKLWIAAGGESLLWLRLFPVAWSVIAVYPFLRFCGELKIGKWTRLLALFLFAVNGSLIKYSQEVRMYAPLMCLSLFSMWLFARYFVKGKSLVPLVIVNVLMVYTHYFGWFVVVAEVGAILWFQRIKWRRIALMLGIVAAAFLPWLIAVITASRSGSELGQNIGWMDRPGIREIVIFVLNVIEPFFHRTSSAEPQSQLIVSVPLAILIAITAIAFVIGWKTLAIGRRTNLWLIVLFIKLPVVVAFAASWLLPYSIWGTRHLITAFPPFWIFVAVMLAGIKVRWIGGVLVALVLGWSVFGLVNRSQLPPPERPWCACSSLLGSADENRAANIYLFTDLDAYQSWFPMRASARRVFKVELDETLGDRAYFLPRGFDAVQRVAIDAIPDQKFWIIFGESGHEPVRFEEQHFESRGYRTTRVEVYPGKFGPMVLALVEK